MPILSTQSSNNNSVYRNSSTLHQLGFTLIEVLVAVSIIGLIAAISIPGFRNFNQAQELESSRSRLYDELRLAQSKANNGVICPGVEAFVASLQIEWAVEVQKKQYITSYNCINDTDTRTSGSVLQTTDFDTIQFPESSKIELSNSSCGKTGQNPNAPYISFFSRSCPTGTTCKNFEVRCGGKTGSVYPADQSFEIILKNGQNLERKITITQGGAIYESPIYESQ